MQGICEIERMGGWHLVGRGMEGSQEPSVCAMSTAYRSIEV